LTIPIDAITLILEKMMSAIFCMSTPLALDGGAATPIN
jgi:hypothetical protein